MNESKNQVAAKELVAEMLGSMFLVMAAVSPMIMFTEVLDAPIGVALLANAVAVAFVLCALIEIFRRISGAHFNPVVTMVMLTEKRIGRQKAALFVTVQFAGGIIGMIISHLMFFDEVGSVLAISDNVRSGHVFIGEVFGTFILVMAILLLVKAKSSMISIIIGLLVGGQIVSTSSTMFANPQVTVARMFTDTILGIRPIDGMIFIVMQVIGALLAYLVYRFVFAKNKINNINDVEDTTI